MKYLEGISLSPGFASGSAVIYDFEVGRRLAVSPTKLTSEDVDSEWERLDKALELSHRDLQLLDHTASKLPNLSKSVAILSAHSAMTHEIVELVKQHVGRELVNVEDALESVIGEWVDRLQRLDNEYLRQREQDVRDVGRRMTRYLAGSLPWHKGPLPEGSIVVARELLPSEAIELANCNVAAIVSERGGRYSHTAILASSLGIPAISRILHATSVIRPGMRLLVDGVAGKLIVSPSKSEEAHFEGCRREYEQRIASVSLEDEVACETQDGTEITLFANLGRPEELDAVREQNLAGVGLFRTEFLFLEAHERPDTDTQIRVYGDVARRLDGLPLVIRTFDLGGDKLPPFLADEADTPGALHLRGLRFSLAEEHLLHEQLYAILRVAQDADVRILFPMVVGSDDFSRALAMVDRIVDQCNYKRTPPIGAMIETPAALFALDEIFDLADFIALGTNDLTQYMLATDRDLAEEQDDCTALHPAVLRAIQQVVLAAARHQCPVSVCGEEAGDAAFACLLIGLGIRELSLSPRRGASVRQVLRGISSQQAAETARRALSCQTPKQVRALVVELTLRERNQVEF